MTCAKCGSGPIIDGVRILEEGHDGIAKDVSATIHTHSRALIFSGKVGSPLVGRACGNCGYLELYISNPAAFVESQFGR